MPTHVLIVHLALAVVPLTAVMGLVYGLSARSRRGMRWPLLVGSLASMVVLVIADRAGRTLLKQVEAHASSAEVAAAKAHAHGSDSAFGAVFVLLVFVLSTVWGVLRPGRPVTAASRVVGALLSLVGLLTLLALGQVVGAGLHAAWLGRGL